MPNGIDGWIADKTSKSDDAIREALEYEASEDRDRRRKVKDANDDFDRTPNEYYRDSNIEVSDYVSQDAIDFNAWLSEMGGNAKIDMDKYIWDIQEDLGKRIEDERQRMKEEDGFLPDWLTDLFDTLGGKLDEFHIDMPSITMPGLSALGLLPSILTGGFELIKSLVTIDEETYVEDCLRLLALQTKVQEKIGKILKPLG